MRTFFSGSEEAVKLKLLMSLKRDFEAFLRQAYGEKKLGGVASNGTCERDLGENSRAE